jgi:hypothetical protein
MRVDSAVAARGQQFAHSRELSDRLTQIARTKGMLSGKGIKVYLSNNIALLQGAVRTPGDRVLLAYVLNLEPEVRWIDNQLVVKGSSELSANHQSP